MQRRSCHLATVDATFAWPWPQPQFAQQEILRSQEGTRKIISQDHCTSGCLEARGSDKSEPPARKKPRLTNLGHGLNNRTRTWRCCAANSLLACCSCLIKLPRSRLLDTPSELFNPSNGESEDCGRRSCSSGRAQHEANTVSRDLVAAALFYFRRS